VLTNKRLFGTIRRHDCDPAVDHVLLQTDAPEALFATLSDVFALPVVAPFRPYGTFASGLVCAGNANVEALRLGPPASGPEARAKLFGIAFEPVAIADAIAELDARGIEHSPPAPYPHDGELKQWTNVAINGMLPASLVFLCEYNVDIEAVRAAQRAELRACSGGMLGIESLREIEITATDVADAIARWEVLLSPAISPQRGTWLCGGGPAIRVRPGTVDAITSLTFDVRSLRAAGAFLERDRMLGAAHEGEVRIAPEAVQGLDLRLRDAGR
jgi:hypothetical protein